MLINRKEVKQIAVLAKLQVSEVEIDAVAASLDAVIDMINDINQADTEDISPMANPMDAVQRMRSDTVTETSIKQPLLDMAEQADEDYYLVPTVVE